MKRLSISVLVLFAAAAAVATGARADGLPVLGVDVGSSGVESGDGSARYVTIPSGRNTIVERVNPTGGSIDAYRLVHGTFTIPAVAYDASAGGLSGSSAASRWRWTILQFMTSPGPVAGPTPSSVFAGP